MTGRVNQIGAQSADPIATLRSFMSINEAQLSEAKGRIPKGHRDGVVKCIKEFEDKFQAALKTERVAAGSFQEKILSTASEKLSGIVVGNKTNVEVYDDRSVSRLARLWYNFLRVVGWFKEGKIYVALQQKPIDPSSIKALLPQPAAQSPSKADDRAPQRKGDEKPGVLPTTPPQPGSVPVPNAA